MRDLQPRGGEMTRGKLKKINGERATFRGTFIRVGTKPGWTRLEKTILLENVQDASGRVVTGHLWFNYTKGFMALGKLNPGDVIQFDARVKAYRKGYQGRRDDVYKPVSVDYKLSHPTKLSKVKVEK